MCKSRLAVALQFNSISKVYTIEDFINFKTAIDSDQVESYFKKFPNEERIFFRSGCKDLMFNFTNTEILELRLLMDKAFYKYKLYEDIGKNLN